MFPNINKGNNNYILLYGFLNIELLKSTNSYNVGFYKFLKIHMNLLWWKILKISNTKDCLIQIGQNGICYSVLDWV